MFKLCTVSSNHVGGGGGGVLMKHKQGFSQLSNPNFISFSGEVRRFSWKNGSRMITSIGKHLWCKECNSSIWGWWGVGVGVQGMKGSIVTPVTWNMVLKCSFFIIYYYANQSKWLGQIRKMIAYSKSHCGSGKHPRLKMNKKCSHHM